MSSISTSSVLREPCEGVACSGGVHITFYCAQCNCSFCGSCWDKQPPHKPHKRGSDAHEKIDRLVFERYRNILEPSSLAQDKDELHKNDEDTTWFGVGRNQTEEPIFEDYGRYSTLMLETLSEEHKVRYPQLVSFIGQTGAGKSTVVKMLINHQDMKTNQTAEIRAATPVVGSVNDNIPTSADVHLYADPNTALTDTPVLYADCEGLEGGESSPIAEAFKIQESSSQRKGTSDTRSRLKSYKKRHTVSRKLSWAKEEKSKREYAVTELYPRLLYTFSDVVVFVLRNAKTFESAVLTKLIQWASASFEKSLGQPALPHVIIALNATDLSIDRSQWDVEEATRKFFSDVEACIEGSVRRNSVLSMQIDEWRRKGRLVNTTKDLLECYYSSVTVVRIPTKGRYLLIDQQVGRLQTEIMIKCNESLYKKRRVRMLSNSDDLQLYLELAFDHFSQNLMAPFNFVEVGLKINPIPMHFGGNIQKLAITTKERHPNFTVALVFSHLSLMVASCIMLDIHRNRRLGTPSQLLEDYYMSYCEQAFYGFCTRHWPCEFKKKDNSCVSVYSGHLKGHQNATGKVFADGAYQAGFNPDDILCQWIQWLEEELSKVHESREKMILEREDLTAEEITSKLHADNLKKFYSRLGASNSFVSHWTCFCCLRETPVHALTCGHVLCSPCVSSYGTSKGKGFIEIKHCPLDLEPEMPLQSYHIKVKPPLAGVRVLCLDGGGMRGIVELEVLKAIQSELPPNIPIRSFFDLIVGTSTGGIIALGLGVEGWSVWECIEQFEKLCDTAFTPRELHGVPGLELLAAMHHSYSRYKSKPFESILKDSFSKQSLFGGQQAHLQPSVKVAVTSTIATGQKAILLANYSRRQFSDSQVDYWFERAEKPEQELFVWEAARATSAAPSYFKAFRSTRNKRVYLDGALYHNNPVQVADLERRLIWPDTAGLPPDILLSIGTSCNQSITNKARNSLQEPSFSLPDIERESRSRMGKLITLMRNRVGDILNTEITWLRFMSAAVRGDEDDKKRYQRINPDIKEEPPKLDDKDQRRRLQLLVQRLLKDGTLKRQISSVARQLIASCFYVEITQMPTNIQEFDTFVSAQIQCKFPSDSQEIRNLGENLKNVTTQNFQPYFAIGEKDSGSTPSKIILTLDIIQKMTTNASFNVGLVQIPITSETAIASVCLSLISGEEHPISGFPRSLKAQKATKASSLYPVVSPGTLSHRKRFFELRGEKDTQADESSGIVLPELHQLPRDAKLPIFRFVQGRIASFADRGEEVPLKLKILAEATECSNDQSTPEEPSDDQSSAKESLDDKPADDEMNNQKTNYRGGPYGTILHTACVVGNKWVAELQIKSGVDVNAVDDHGWTASMIAKAQNHPKCAKLFSEHTLTKRVKTSHEVLPPTGLIESEPNSCVKISMDLQKVKLVEYHPSLQKRIQVRANHPIPPGALNFYYEITILKNGPLGIVGFGLCRPETPSWGMPGWTLTSWGYYGDDGMKYNNANKEEGGLRYANTYSVDDTVGCGINIQTGKLFFTKNGVNLGVAFSNVKGMLFPVIGIGEREVEVRVNFGDRPFEYQIQAHDWRSEESAIQIRAKVPRLPVGILG